MNLMWEAPDKKKQIYTVSEATSWIRKVLEEKLAGIWVEGEVSNFRIPSSGHIYFTLKDEEGQLRAVMFKSAAQRLKFRLEDGLKVVALGTVSLYERRGECQIVVEELEPKGVGALQLAFEQLKKKLEEEGLFAEEHKKPLPLFPRQIGIVTSPTGAAIRDILNVIERRFSKVKILINPVPVQGAGAAEEIAHAIEELNATRGIEVIIVGRGGGSIEDLWAFNEEVVARAIYNSRIPIISAVGHEIDYCISDFVADLRAPTPSAAAELVVTEMEKLLEKIRLFLDSSSLAMQNLLENYRSKVQRLSSSYGFRRMADRIRQYQQEIDEMVEKVRRMILHGIELYRGRLKGLSGNLEALSPLAILGRGYSLTFKLPKREIVKDAQGLEKGDRVEVMLSRGAFISRVEELKAEREER